VTDLSELDAALEDAPTAAPSFTGATGRPAKCRRHSWQPNFDVEDRSHTWWECARCGTVKDEARSRRGRTNRNRGNAIEREVAARLGLRRVGMYGTPEDASGDYLVVQVKSGASFPERVWRWLNALTADANQTRAVVLTDAPGPGRRRRALIVLTLEDWVALHGPSGEDAA